MCGLGFSLKDRLFEGWGGGGLGFFFIVHGYYVMFKSGLNVVCTAQVTEWVNECLYPLVLLSLMIAYWVPYG